MTLKKMSDVRDFTDVSNPPPSDNLPGLHTKNSQTESVFKKNRFASEADEEKPLNRGQLFGGKTGGGTGPFTNNSRSNLFGKARTFKS